MTNIFDNLKNKKVILILLIGIILGIILLMAEAQNTIGIQQTQKETIYTEDYVSTLEKKTEDMLNSINGVTDTKVMITLKDNGKQVFALDGADSNAKHVIVDNSLVCTNEIMPEIEGVAVVCKGGDNAQIKQKITELLCSLLGIYSTHIYITE